MPLGVESLAEFVEADVIDTASGPAEVMTVLQKELPQDLVPLAVEQIPLNEPPISAKIQQLTFEVRLPQSLDTELVAEAIRSFREAGSFEISRDHKGKTTVRDLKEWVENVSFSDGCFVMVLRSGASGSVNPLDAAAGILGLDREDVRAMHIVKTAAGLE